MKFGLSFVLILCCATWALALPNPAAENCKKQGGRYVMREDKGSQFGICQWSDQLENGLLLQSECEEWALFHNICKRGECGYWATGILPNDEPYSYCAAAAEPVVLSPPPVA